MEKFINKIAQTIYASKKEKLEDLCIVLPSKRAGTFFKQALADLSDVPLWMPKIYSIEMSKGFTPCNDISIVLIVLRSRTSLNLISILDPDLIKLRPSAVN